MKWLIKLHCPSGETLAGYAAEALKLICFWKGGGN